MKRVLRAGQEALVRRMTAPILPAGWAPGRVRIAPDRIVAAYAGEAGRAEIEIAVGDEPDADERFRLRVRGSADGAAVRALAQAVGASIRAHEAELAWEAPEAGPRAVDRDALSVARALAPGPALERFRVLERSGRTRDALALARQTGDTELLVASALVRLGLLDDEGAAADARAALAAVAEERADRSPAFGPARAKLAIADVLAAAGERDEPRRLVEEVLRTEPISAGLLDDVASVLVQAGDDDRALELRRRAHALEPTSARAAVALAESHAWRGEADAVEALAVSACSEAPAAAERFLGVAAALAEDWARARRHFDRAHELAPDHRETAIWRAEAMLHVGDLDGASAESRRARDMGRDATTHVPGLAVEAAVLARRGELDRIEPALRDAMAEICPDRPTDFEAALRAMRGNRTETATWVAGRELRRVSVTPSARQLAKQALWRFPLLGDAGATERGFEAVHARFPETAEIHNYRGELWLQAGDPARARACFEAAHRLDPKSRWAFIGLGAAAILEDRPADALAILARGVAIGGPGPTTYVYRGEAHRLLGHDAEARADLLHAVRAHPSRIGAWVNLGLLQTRTGDPDLAATLDALRERAACLVDDATASAGSEPVALLETMRRMLRGNRASAVVTYFAGDELRLVPPHR